MNRQMMYKAVYARARILQCERFRGAGPAGAGRAEGPASAEEAAAREGIHGGSAAAARRPIRPGSLRDNLRKARDLLADAGWTYRDGALRNPKGEPFTLEYLDSGGGERLVGARISRRWRSSASPANTGAPDFALIRKRLDVFDFDLFTVRIPGSEAPGCRARRSLWLGLRRHRRLEQPDGDQGPGDRRAGEPGGVLAHAAGAGGALRALDRVLRHHYFVVPQWYSSTFRHRLTARENSSNPK
jgi:microcin C transport system substrate-binding protein